MKVTLKVEQEFDIKTLHVRAGVRNWEDTSVNGVKDTDGHLIPFSTEDEWCPVIDIDSGRILDWPEGVVANIHYKVCDDGTYQLKDNSGAIVREYDGYVPDCMCPEGDGWSDYIIMKVDADGSIQGWDFDVDDFMSHFDD